MAKVRPRDISGALQIIRNFLLGRKLVNSLRFQDKLAARTQPPPNLPGGPSHKIETNYYYTRDGRRESKPPVVIAELHTSKKQITAGKSSEQAAGTPTKIPAPGQPYKWGDRSA